MNVDDFDDLDDYLIRDSVFDEIEAKTPAVCNYLLENEIDYDNDHQSLADAIVIFFDDIEEMTDAEATYCISHIQINTALQKLLNDGLIERIGDTYRVKQ